MNSVDYSQAWQDCRRRTQIALVVFVGWPIYTIAVANLAEKFVGRSWIPLFLLPYVVLFFYANYRRASFLCPRCGHYFFRKAQSKFFLLQNPYARQCLNCGLPKFSNGEDVNG